MRSLTVFSICVFPISTIASLVKPSEEVLAHPAPPRTVLPAFSPSDDAVFRLLPTPEDLTKSTKDSSSFKLNGDQLREIYLPPNKLQPDGGRYPIKEPAGFEANKAQREYIFTYLISPQLHKLLRQLPEKKDQDLITKILEDTSRLAKITLPQHEASGSAKTGIIAKIFSLLPSRHKTPPLPSFPSAYKIMSTTKNLFEKLKDKKLIGVRRELWTLILYHAFHDTNAESDLIQIYRDSDFRQTLIEYMLKADQGDLNPQYFSWPFHRHVLAQGYKDNHETQPAYHNFFTYHSYLLRRNSNELMERLDRDVLVSQLRKEGPSGPDDKDDQASQLENSNIKLRLAEATEKLPGNWRYQDGTDAENLAEESLRSLEASVRKSSEPKLITEEYRAVVDVLFHLRVFGTPKLRKLIESRINIMQSSPLNLVHQSVPSSIF